jgi:plastocyanin
MRSTRLLVAALTIVAVAACTTSTPGWTYAPASASPIPSAEASGSAEPSGSVAPSVAPSAAASATASPASSASAGPGESTTPSASTAAAAVELSAQNITFDKTALSVPAGAAFQLVFHNNDAGIPHNVEIKDGTGASVFKGEIFSGVDSRTYDVTSLAAGAYKFVCSVHPNMVGELTAQ